MAAVQPIGGVARVGIQPNLCSRLYELAEAIAQIAVKILFVTASILMAASAFPITWHAIVIPVVAIGTSVLAGFFYPQPNPIQGALFGLLPPLVRPVQALANGELPADFPADAPRGFQNRGTQNCAFNSMADLLECEPELAHFNRHPLTDDIDLPGFRNFLAGYNPPAHLVAQFDAYVAAAAAPHPPIPTMFATFIDAYQPPIGDHNAVNAIRSTYHNLRLVQRPFSEFYRAYDEAVAARQAHSRGNAQNLRVALNQVTALVDPSPHHQMDVSEAMGPYLDLLPDPLKAKVRTTYHFNTAGLPDMLEVPQPKEERVGYFSLPIKGNNLNELFHSYCNGTEHEPQRYFGVDGKRHDYPVDRVTVRLLEPPPALRFHIKRFGFEMPPVSWYSRWFPKLFPPLGARGIKLDPPIDFPPEYTLTLENGQVHKYRLAAFINHHGTTPGGGHYTDARIVGGNKYLKSDEEVTLVTPEHQGVWDERLQHAYFLDYLLVPPEPAAPGA